MQGKLFKWIGTIILLGTVLLLSSCATERNYSVAVRSWQTASSYALLNRWGYPDKIDNLTKGERQFVYYARRRPDYKISCTTWFIINKRGKVVGSGFRGHFCRASKGFLNTMGNQKRVPFMLKGM